MLPSLSQRWKRHSPVTWLEQEAGSASVRLLGADIRRAQINSSIVYQEYIYLAWSLGTIYTLYLTRMMTLPSWIITRIDNFRSV